MNHASSRIPGSQLDPSHVLHVSSARLVLRRFTVDDVALLMDLDSDPEVVRYVGPQNPDPKTYLTESVMPRVLGYYEKWSDRGIWAAHERDGGAFIGWFHYRPDREPPHDPELGYRLARRAWGKGYATEMGRALVAHGFDTLGDEIVVAHAMLANRASWRVMEKLGMSRRREYVELGEPAVAYAVTPDAFVRGI